VLLSRTALKELKALDDKNQKRLKAGLRKIEGEPFKSRSGADIKKLRGTQDPVLYRLRVGTYRVIYAVMGKEVKVTEIIHRSKGYSFLE
jgi:mRNA interferase RelE/StbE